MSEEFISSRMLDIQNELTGFVEKYMLALIKRISILEHEIGRENIQCIPSDSEEASLLLKLEAMTLNKKSTLEAGKQSGLKQQVSELQNELRKTNAKVKELEILLNKTNSSHTEASLRNLVKVEVDAVLEERDKLCVFKNSGKPVQEMSPDDTQTTNLQRGISESSTLTTWSREKSYDESDKSKVPDVCSDRATTGHGPSDSDQEDIKSRQDKMEMLRGGVRDDHQPRSFDGMIEENLQELTIHGVSSPISNRNGKQPPSLEGRVEQSDRIHPTASTRTLDQPMSLESRVEGDTSGNTHIGMHHTDSSRTIDQPMSLEGLLEGDTSGNTHVGIHPTASTRTLDQPMSLEGLLEGDTSGNTHIGMHHTASSRTIDQPMSLEGLLEGDTCGNTHIGVHHTASSRTIDQPMSLEGMLEGDKRENIPGYMQPAISSRTLVNQPMSLEGMLEGNTSGNIPGEIQPAISSRTLVQPMSLEGMLEGNKTEAASEAKPPAVQRPSAPKVSQKTFKSLFHKKDKKGSKVPDAGDPVEAGLSGTSKVKESSKGKKS